MIVSVNKIRNITNSFYLEEVNSNGALEVPESLKKIANGVDAFLSKDDIHEIVEINYPHSEDIFVESIKIKANSFDPNKLSNLVFGEGQTVDFASVSNFNSSFPEIDWDHISLTLLSVIIIQAGKVSHNVLSEGFNGVALRDLSLKFKRAAPMTVIKFKYESEFFERKGQVFSNSKWKFSYYDKKRQRDVIFATFETGSQGVDRDYNGFNTKSST